MTIYSPPKNITELRSQDIPEGTTTLDLSGCQQLTTLPKKLPAGLTHLYLRGCLQLTTLPEELPADLTFLELSDCLQLKTLPENLPAGLTYLRLSNCRQLKKLPDKLPANLTYLYLSGCKQLTTLPEILPAGLKYLDLSGCQQLTTLPEKFPAGLRSLDLSGCDSLPNNIETIQKLLDLEISNRGNENFRLIWPSHLDRSFETTQIKNNLKEAYKIYYSDNDQFRDRDPEYYSTYRLIHRYITESVGQRGGLLTITNSALQVSEKIKNNPSLLEVLDQSAGDFLDACVNQPVAGFSEIATLAEIASQPDIPSKLEKAKILFAMELIKEEVANLGTGRSVEVELGNAMLREVHNQLIRNNIITQNWPGIPEGIAYEAFIRNHLTEENIDRISLIVKTKLESLNDPKILVEEILTSYHSDFWTKITVDKDIRDEINKPCKDEEQKIADGSEDVINPEQLQMLKIECSERLIAKSR